VGIESKLFIQLLDAYGNQILQPNTTASHSLEEPSMPVELAFSSQEIQPKITETQDPSIYCLTYTPTRRGKVSMSLFFHDHEGGFIGKNSFEVDVYPGKPVGDMRDAARELVREEFVVAGDHFSFQFLCRDENGDPETRFSSVNHPFEAIIGFCSTPQFFLSPSYNI